MRSVFCYSTVFDILQAIAEEKDDIEDRVGRRERDRCDCVQILHLHAEDFNYLWKPFGKEGYGDKLWKIIKQYYFIESTKPLQQREGLSRLPGSKFHSFVLWDCVFFAFNQEMYSLKKLRTPHSLLTYERSHSHDETHAAVHVHGAGPLSLDPAVAHRCNSTQREEADESARDWEGPKPEAAPGEYDEE